MESVRGTIRVFVESHLVIYWVVTNLQLVVLGMKRLPWWGLHKSIWKPCQCVNKNCGLFGSWLISLGFYVEIKMWRITRLYRFTLGVIAIRDPSVCLYWQLLVQSFSLFWHFSWKFKSSVIKCIESVWCPRLSGCHKFEYLFQMTRLKGGNCVFLEGPLASGSSS